MLGSMRANKKNQTVIWIILGLLALGLVGFGGIGAGGGSVRSVGQVGDEEISIDVYAQAMNTSIANLSQQLGRTVTAAEAQAFGVQNNVMQNLISVAALDNETGRLGISIGDAAVRAQLLANPAFQGLDGAFDKDTYTYTLERTRISQSEYDTLLRKEAARSILQSSITAGVKSQGTQTHALLAYERENRDFTWAKLTDQALAAPIPAPTASQIQSQYEATPKAYTAPLIREITYAWLTPGMLASSVNIDEAMIKESYELQSDRFNKPEKRSVERLIYGTLEEANADRNLLDAGTVTFDTLLADRDLTAADVDLGELTPGGLEKEAAKLVFAATGTGIVGPVKSSLGPALFRINAILAEDITPYENARDEILGELSGEAGRRLVTDLVTDIDDLLAGGATMDDLAKETDMQLGTISYSVGTTTGIAAYDNFREVAAQSQPSDFAEIKDLADGGIFALEVTEIKQPTLRPLGDVKDTVALDWVKAETLRQLTVLANALKDDIEVGASFGSLATHTEKTVGRAGFIENTPPEMLTELFKIDASKAIVSTGSDGIFIARLDQVNAYDGNSSENQTLATIIQRQLDTQLSNDMLNAFSGALRDDAGLTLNQAAITSINSQLMGGYN